MSSDVLRDQLHRVPFKSVTPFLPSGKTITVNNPELAMFSETGRTLIVTQGERVLLIDVATVEMVETVWGGDPRRPPFSMKGGLPPR